MGLSKERKHSLSRRFLRLAWGNPGAIQTQFRLLYRQKLGIDMDRRFRRGLSGPPANLGINLTRRCNLNCLMCDQYRKDNTHSRQGTYYDPGRELPLEAWTALLDQAASFRPQLYITGGEPLLYPRFLDFMKAAKQRRLFVHLQTNGTLLSRMAHRLVSLGLDAVTVSLDGPEQIHDRIRGQKGVFRRTTEGIEALVRVRKRLKTPGPILSINCVISRHNLSTLEKMVDLALELGADILQLQHTIFDTKDNVERHNRLLSCDGASSLGLDLMAESISEGGYYQNEFLPEDLPILMKGLKEVIRRSKGRIKLLFFPGLPLEMVEPYYLDLDHPFSQSCDYLWKTCRILPDGTVSPCLHVLIGNIRDEPLLALWNGPQMRRFRTLITERLFPGCARCCHRNYKD